jgi:hypothetical protein
MDRSRIAVQGGTDMGVGPVQFGRIHKIYPQLQGMADKPSPFLRGEPRLQRSKRQSTVDQRIYAHTGVTQVNLFHCHLLAVCLLEKQNYSIGNLFPRFQLADYIVDAPYRF